jgi:hypothetical protein
MNSRAFGINSTRALILAAALVGTPGWGYAQEPAQAKAHEQAHEARAPYPIMAAITEYMGADPTAEIALARSAAPPALSRDATILVLGQHGYEPVVKGTNGFVCVVERSWMSPFESPEFWNPKMRGPLCFNPAAVRAVLPFTIKRTEMAFAGVSKAQMKVRLKEAFESKEIPALEPGAMSYMLSRHGVLGDKVGHWHPHLMFYAPKSDGADWGANLAGSPVLLDLRPQSDPEPWNTFLVPVSHWSDGSAASEHGH